MSEIPSENALISPQDALIAVMFAVSVSDESISNSELLSISRIVDHLPIFADYDISRIKRVSQTVLELFSVDEGLDALFGIVRDALPDDLNETAYAMACDVAASDGHIRDGELQLLEEIRHELKIDRLHAAAIERGARARHMRWPHV
jgi:tellurite resistance protein